MTTPPENDNTNHKLHFPAGTLGDVYNARLFEQLYKDQVFHNNKYGGWHIFKDIWRLDDIDIIKLFSIEIFVEKNTDGIFHYFVRNAAY